MEDLICVSPSFSVHKVIDLPGPYPKRLALSQIISLAGKKCYIDAVFFKDDQFLVVSFVEIIEIYCKVNGQYKLLKDIYNHNIRSPSNLTVIDNERKLAFLCPIS